MPGIVSTCRERNVVSHTDYDFLYEKAAAIPAWKHIGAVVAKVEEGYAEVELTFVPQLANYLGVLQGGFVTAIADAAGGWALATLIERESLITTVELKVNFLLPIQQDVVAKGRVLRCGTKIGVSSIEVCLKDGEVTAAGIGTYYLKRPNSS